MQKTNRAVYIIMFVGGIILGTVVLQNMSVGFENYEICFTRIPIFVIGCYFGKMSYEENKLRSNIVTYIILLAVVIVVWKVG